MYTLIVKRQWFGKNGETKTNQFESAAKATQMEMLARDLLGYVDMHRGPRDTIVFHDTFEALITNTQSDGLYVIRAWIGKSTEA